MSVGNKERLFALGGIAALKVNSPSTRAGFLLPQCLIYTPSNIYVHIYVLPCQGPRRPTRTHRDPRGTGELLVKHFQCVRVRPSALWQSPSQCSGEGDLHVCGTLTGNTRWIRSINTHNACKNQSTDKKINIKLKQERDWGWNGSLTLTVIH